jgi:hypothetical protein
MESLLAYYVVEQSEEIDAMVQLPTASAYRVYLPSQLRCRWLNSGICLPLIERMFCLRVGQIGKAHLAGTEQIVMSWTNPTYLKSIHMVVEFDYTLW